MPGTIQVTVVEFKGVSSTGMPSAKSVKVSMGKTNYQTWDNGEFLFPLTKLREDVVVSLLDAGGNEIAHTDVKTIQIIEKGSWDEVFSLIGGGGGRVHLKLQFVLNEDEIKRIRQMRDSAVKKKKLEKAKPIVDASETSQKKVSAGFFSDSADASFNHIQTHNDADSFAASNVPTGVISSKKLGVASNVRKMITAFENNQLQETKEEVKSTLKKAQSSPSLSQFKKLRIEQLDEEEVDNHITKLSRKPKEDLTEAVHSNASNVTKSRENDSNVSSSSSPEETSCYEKTSLLDIKRQSDSANASCSWIMIEAGKGRRRITSLKSSTTKTNRKENILECYKEGYCGAWIFPDNHTRPLCITSAGKLVKKLLGGDENDRAKKVSKGIEKAEKNDDNTVSEGGVSNGLIEQVIKVAVIFGFGLLVVFTRQREPTRKRKG